MNRKDKDIDSRTYRYEDIESRHHTRIPKDEVKIHFSEPTNNNIYIPLDSYVYWDTVVEIDSRKISVRPYITRIEIEYKVEPPEESDANYYRCIMFDDVEDSLTIVNSDEPILDRRSINKVSFFGEKNNITYIDHKWSHITRVYLDNMLSNIGDGIPTFKPRNLSVKVFVELNDDTNSLHNIIVGVGY